MFQYNCEVFYEDTDMGGRVYHANYLKFIERARSKLIESLNVDQRLLLLEEKKFFIVKSIWTKIIKFLGWGLMKFSLGRTQRVSLGTIFFL